MSELRNISMYSDVAVPVFKHCPVLRFGCAAELRSILFFHSELAETVLKYNCIHVSYRYPQRSQGGKYFKLSKSFELFLITYFRV
jgi:hypothetical protein